MECPKCNKSGFEVEYQEVDLEVGIDKVLIGGFCKECGYLTVCMGCGAWEGLRPCFGWCSIHGE